MGVNGAKLTMYGTITIAVVDIILAIFLIPIFGIAGSIIATAISYCAGLAVIHIKRPYRT
jgi:O-antigen/teichoic acid export membrane protein